MSPSDQMLHLRCGMFPGLEIIQKLNDPRAALRRGIENERQFRHILQDDGPAHDVADLAAFLLQPTTAFRLRRLAAEHRIKYAALVQIRRNAYARNGDAHRLALVARVQVGADLALDKLVDAQGTVAHSIADSGYRIPESTTRKALSNSATRKTGRSPPFPVSGITSPV